MVSLDWLHVIALLGAIQGVLLAATLATKRTNRAANGLLAATMLSFSVYLASAVYHAAGLLPRYPHFFGVGYAQLFLFGPLVYLYAVTAADRSRGLRWWDAIHFAPFALFVILALPIYLMNGAEKVAFYERLLRGDVPMLIAVADPLKLISGISYAVATVVLLLRHRERVKASYSTTERVNLGWLLWLGSAAGFVWLMAVVFQVVEFSGARVSRSEDIISLAIAVIVYTIGYRGLRQPEIFHYETAEYAVPSDLVAMPAARPEVAVIGGPGESAATPTGPRLVRDDPGEDPGDEMAPRYERSGLSERQAERLKDALLALMDGDKPWRNSELTLADLAAMLRTTPHKLSEVLNAMLGTSFYDFVNGYRVREVQRRIAAGEAQRVKMLSLALDAGFASKSTFNMVFKKHTNQTPSDYRQAAGA